MPPDDKKDPLDPKSFLLPKKEGPSPASAQRINAGALLEQEQHAAQEGAPAEPAAQKSSDLRPPDGQTFAPQVPPPPSKGVSPASTIKPLQTYSGDISTAVEGGASVISIAAAEAERRGKGAAPAVEEQAPARGRSIVYIGAGVLLLLAAGAVVTFLFIRPAQQAAQLQTQAPFISVDDTAGVALPPNLERDAVMQALDTARASVHLSVGLIERLYPGFASSTGIALIPPQTLLGVLAPNIPQDFLRSIEPQYLLGVHSYDENQAFLMLRVDSYQQAYAGLLGWESTMDAELLPLFLRTPPTHVQDANASSTTPQFVPTMFVDEVVENHDARVLRNAQGDMLMLWTFLDRNTVVIATNEATLREIIRRATEAPVVPQP